MMALRLLVSEIWWHSGHFFNGRQNPHGGNLAWHYSKIYLVWYGVHLCQVACFYHKMHDSLNFGHLAAGLERMTKRDVEKVREVRDEGSRVELGPGRKAGS